jgi:hypothetical protein
MSLRRRGILPLGILLVIAAVIALTGAVKGSASTPKNWTSCPSGSPPTSGRAYCVVLTTYDGVQATGGQRIDGQAFNFDQNTLTNPVMTFSWVATDLSVTWSAPKPSNCAAGPNANQVTCTIPNVPGLGAAAKNTPPPPPNPSQTVTLFFSTQATGPAPAVTWTLTVRANEGPSGDPNTAVRSVSGNTTFGTDADSNLTFALPGQNVLLGTTATGKASLRFGVPGGNTAPYETSLNADDTTGFCLEGLDCYPLELTSSVPGATGGLLVWHWVALNPSFNRNTVKVIHVKDGAPTTANAANTGANPNSIAGDFRAVEGVRISGGSAFDGDYWVRFPTATSFQISVEKTGPIFDIPGTGTLSVTAGKADIVDQRDEDCKKTLTDPSHAGPVALPSLWADSVDADSDGKTDDVELWFCDNGNGNVGGF